MNETRLKELFTAAVSAPATDRLDIDAAVVGGRRRYRVRTAATAGAVLGVIALAAGVVVVALPGRATPPELQASLTPVTSAAAITGRWTAVSIDGRDVTNAPPATVIFGASGFPDSWQLQTACAPPEPSGRITTGPDGQFRAVATLGGTVHCPQLLTGPPDLLGVLTNARYARTSAPDHGSSGVTLTLLDANRAVLSQLRPEPLTGCRDVELTVTFDGAALRAENGTSQPCQLSGKDAVSVPWWRLNGAVPVAPVGILLPGDTLVQPYESGATNGCPNPGVEQPTDLAVSVDGRAYIVTLPGKMAREVQVCDSATALAPTIQPGPNSPTA